MGTFSPRADCGAVLCHQAWVPDTVAKWRTRSFSRINYFGVGSYGVGRVRQPGKIAWQSRSGGKFAFPPDGSSRQGPLHAEREEQKARLDSVLPPKCEFFLRVNKRTITLLTSKAPAFRG